VVDDFPTSFIRWKPKRVSGGKSDAALVPRLKNQAKGRHSLIRFISVLSTNVDFADWRFCLGLLALSKWRLLAEERRILPVPVILKRLAAAFLVLRLAIAFGIRGPRKYTSRRDAQQLI